MRISTLFSFFILRTVLAAPLSDGTDRRLCGNEISAEAARAVEEQFRIDFKSASRNGTGSDSIAPINVVWHVIYDTDTVEGGLLPDDAISSSITAMNSHYQGSGFSFSLYAVTRTQNSEWFNGADDGTAAELAMKTSLRVGDASTLNLYTVNLGGGILGYAKFPWDYSTDPVKDGVVILFTTYPGGPQTNYDEGKTLSHEVGHWLGLYHVFEGDSCSGPGDYVDDTPPQLTSTSGCPAFKDTCDGDGPDSIHNYMDYSYDSCMTEFTNGQMSRAMNMVSTYRGIY